MEGEAAEEAERAAEEANYAHVGTTIIISSSSSSSARAHSQQQTQQQQQQQQRQLPPISTSHILADHGMAGGSDEAFDGLSHTAASSTQLAVLRQPPSPTVTTSPLSSLSPRSPPPPPPIARSPPAPPSRRPPTSPSPRPPTVGSLYTRSTPATPLTSAADPPTPPPLLQQPTTPSSHQRTAALALQAVPTDAPPSPTRLASHPPTARQVAAAAASATSLTPPAADSSNNGGSNQPTPTRSTASQLLSSAGSSSSPPSLSPSGPAPTVADYVSLHSLYSMQCALRVAAESELQQCKSAMAQLEAAAGSSESASAVHVRSLLSSLAAAQKQLDAATQRSKQDEDEMSSLRYQLQQERQARQQVYEALQSAKQQSSEQLHVMQQELRAAKQACLAAEAQQQQRHTEAAVEEKEAEGRTETESRAAQRGEVWESYPIQQTKWAVQAAAASAAVSASSQALSQPPPPVPRRPAPPSESVPPSSRSSPFSSVVASSSCSLAPAAAAAAAASSSAVSGSVPRPFPEGGERRPSVGSVAADCRFVVSSLRPPLSVESVLHYFHSCLRLSDAYLQYLSRFVEEAMEQHSAHSSQLAAVADIAGEVEQNAYELLRRIGAGGFGEVYEGRRKKDGERVAVKVTHRYTATH